MVFWSLFNFDWKVEDEILKFEFLMKFCFDRHQSWPLMTKTSGDISCFILCFEILTTAVPSIIFFVIVKAMSEVSIYYFMAIFRTMLFNENILWKSIAMLNLITALWVSQCAPKNFRCRQNSRAQYDSILNWVSVQLMRDYP